MQRETNWPGCDNTEGVTIWCRSNGWQVEWDRAPNHAWRFPLFYMAECFARILLLALPPSRPGRVVTTTELSALADTLRYKKPINTEADLELAADHLRGYCSGAAHSGC